MRIINDTKLDFNDVLITPKRSNLSSRKEVSLIRKYTFLHSKQTYSGIPIMAANMDTVGNIPTLKILSKHNMFTCLHKFIHEDEDFMSVNFDDYVESMAVSIGMNDELNLKNFNNIKYLCLDVANGYTEKFIRFVKSMREKHPTTTIIAGNVVTPEMTEELLVSGADVVKIGIGPGSACFTRQKTGVGYPQLSAIIECADAAHGLGGHIIGDGGCTTPADIVKGFAAGADFMMIGGMFSCHDENSKFDSEGNSLFYGMSSTEAMKKHYGGVAKHRTSEGRVVKMKSKGSLDDTILDILGGLRSACTYVGAKSLKELTKRATFIKVNNQLNKVYEKNTIGD